jgi:hypothetical protein
VTKDPAGRLGAHDDIDDIRKHPFYKTTDCEGLPKCVKPRFKSNITEAICKGTTLISSHKQLSVKSRVNGESNSLNSKHTSVKFKLAWILGVYVCVYAFE